MTQTELTLTGICVTLLLALLGAVAKGASLAGRMGKTLEHMESNVAKLEKALESVAEIPSLRQRIAQLEQNQSTILARLGSTDAFRAVTKEQIDAARERLAKHERELERRGSSPDLDKT